MGQCNLINEVMLLQIDFSGIETNLVLLLYIEYL